MRALVWPSPSAYSTMRAGILEHPDYHAPVSGPDLDLRKVCGDPNLIKLFVRRDVRHDSILL
jgi:hypothetical protein